MQVWVLGFLSFWINVRITDEKSKVHRVKIVVYTLSRVCTTAQLHCSISCWYWDSIPRACQALHVRIICPTFEWGDLCGGAEMPKDGFTGRDSWEVAAVDRPSLWCMFKFVACLLILLWNVSKSWKACCFATQLFVWGCTHPLYWHERCIYKKCCHGLDHRDSHFEPSPWLVMVRQLLVKGLNRHCSSCDQPLVPRYYDPSRWSCSGPKPKKIKKK